MSYSEFKKLNDIEEFFGFVINGLTDLFSTIPEIKISDTFRETLKENVPLALAVHSEKARSEWIISPVLLEVRKYSGKKISLFSGVEFNVDEEKGLTGFCDFIISLNPEQRIVKAPVITIVEAKDQNMKEGLAQCTVEMIAARLFNQHKKNNITTIYGCVTTGDLWQFLKLEEQTIFIDTNEYHLPPEVEKIFGILIHIVTS